MLVIQWLNALNSANGHSAESEPLAALRVDVLWEYAPLSHERGQVGFHKRNVIGVGTPPIQPQEARARSSSAGLSVDDYIPVRRMEHLPRHRNPVTATAVDEGPGLRFLLAGKTRKKKKKKEKKKKKRKKKGGNILSGPDATEVPDPLLDGIRVCLAVVAEAVVAHAIIENVLVPSWVQLDELGVDLLDCAVQDDLLAAGGDLDFP
ncbi:hypothetical protein V500_05684 [Pseudogymnoascus sp. VKM F-4518 (FW-2643)]|nr:hypothetical protein V500_05684 [Pseudogymnoascus sp. VKM F-4518 (FW-2643)]